MPAINPEILTWARESAGLSLEAAASKLQLKDTSTSTAAEKLGAYEQGREPSRPMLKKMSQQYRKPLLTFYLEKPPARSDRGEDFRTLPDGVAPEDDALVDVLIRDVKARQSILRQTLIEEDEAVELPFIGSIDLRTTRTAAVKKIRKSLGFDLAEFRACADANSAFKYLRGMAEQTGIYVLLMGNLGSHHTMFDPRIFRGFVLADKYAPFIVINDQDARAAWSFTLLHEVAHLWLGQTGVSSAFSDNEVEQYCNDVASEILLPADELRAFHPESSDFDSLATAISEFASAINISSAMMSYRLFRTGYFEERTWRQLSSFFRERWLEIKDNRREKNRTQEGGPNYYVVRRNKLGDALVGFTERMTRSGAISTTKASLLLGVKPIRVHKLFDAGLAA